MASAAVSDILGDVDHSEWAARLRESGNAHHGAGEHSRAQQGEKQLWAGHVTVTTSRKVSAPLVSTSMPIPDVSTVFVLNL